MRRIHFFALSLALGFAPTLALFGDVVYLKNGQSIEGRVTKKDGNVTIRRPSGAVVSVDEKDVSSVVTRKTPAASFRERLEKVPPGKLEPLLELVAWAREKRLRAQLRKVSKRILEVDPNNEMARQELGYVVFENTWVLESELKTNRRERGLVKFRGEWMAVEERERLVEAEDRQEIDGLMNGLDSRNRYVQEFAVRKLVSHRGKFGRKIFSSYLDDRRTLVRIIAISSLGNFPSGAPDPGGDPEAQKITRKLLEMLGEERTKAEVHALFLALRLLQPTESFRRALETLKTTQDERRRDRVAEVVYENLKKEFVLDLCRALVVERDGERVPVHAVRRVLKKALGVDFGYDVERWLAWWKASGRAARNRR